MNSLSDSKAKYALHRTSEFGLNTATLFNSNKSIFVYVRKAAIKKTK